MWYLLILPIKQPKEPLICHKVADQPRQKLGEDVYALDGTDYLCVVDYYSYYYYFEVDRLESKTTAGIAKKLYRQFQSFEFQIS